MPLRLYNPEDYDLRRAADSAEKAGVSAQILGRLRSLRRDESGQAIVLVAVALGVILGFAGLTIDVGQLRYGQQRLQAAADAAALAGALELPYCSASNCAALQTAAQKALVENGLSGSTLVTQCATNSSASFTITVNNGPCAIAGDPNSGNTAYVEVVLSQASPTIFAQIFGINSSKIAARAEARLGNSQFCLDILDPGGMTFLDNGSANVTASCGIMVNSSSSQALVVNGSSTINATAIDVHGGDLINGDPTINPTPVTNAPKLSDPLAWLENEQLPSISGTCQPTPNANSATTINPGTYCSAVTLNSSNVTFTAGNYNFEQGLTLNGSVNATFNTGFYEVQGGMIFNGNDTVTGNGVTFYLPSGSLTMNGSSHADLVAPTTGNFAGVLMYQGATNSSEVILNGDSTSIFQGALYMPDANLTINGGGNAAAYTILDAYSLTVNGGVSFTLGSNYSSLPGGSPAKGTAVLAE